MKKLMLAAASAAMLCGSLPVLTFAWQGDEGNEIQTAGDSGYGYIPMKTEIEPGFGVSFVDDYFRLSLDGDIDLSKENIQNGLKLRLSEPAHSLHVSILKSGNFSSVDFERFIVQGHGMIGVDLTANELKGAEFIRFSADEVKKINQYKPGAKFHLQVLNGATGKVLSEGTAEVPSPMITENTYTRVYSIEKNGQKVSSLVKGESYELKANLKLNAANYDSNDVTINLDPDKGIQITEVTCSPDVMQFHNLNNKGLTAMLLRLKEATLTIKFKALQNYDNPKTTLFKDSDCYSLIKGWDGRINMVYPVFKLISLSGVTDTTERTPAKPGTNQTKPNQPVQTPTKPSGWQSEGGKWVYYDKNGSKKTGWQSIDGKWYLFDSNGIMKTGWQDDHGTWYYLRSNGAMAANGWFEVDGQWYLFDKNGKMKTGWQDDHGTWYYLRKNGQMAKSWQQINGKWYYFNDKGLMKTGWLSDGGKWYYLKSNGAMSVNEDIEGGRTNASGVWTKY